MKKTAIAFYIWAGLWTGVLGASESRLWASRIHKVFGPIGFAILWPIALPVTAVAKYLEPRPVPKQ